MKLIREAAGIEPRLVTYLQQSVAPANSGTVVYMDKSARLTQVDAFGVTIG